MLIASAGTDCIRRDSKGAPEILFGDRAYAFAVDMWGVGCVFGELLLHEPLMPGSTEPKQLVLMTELLGMHIPTRRRLSSARVITHRRARACVRTAPF